MAVRSSNMFRVYHYVTLGQAGLPVLHYQNVLVIRICTNVKLNYYMNQNNGRIMNNFFNLQSMLPVELSAKWRGNSLLSRHYRLSLRTESFLKRLSENISGNLGVVVGLMNNVRVYNAEEELTRFFSSGCIAVQFRMDQEAIVLLFSYEVIYELASIISGRKNQQILTPVTNSELIAVGYYLARILGETQLFGGKIVYLVSVTAYGSANKNTQEFKELLLAKLREDKCFIEYIDLKLEQQSNMFVVFLSSRLARQFLEESMSDVPDNYMYGFLKTKRINCELDLKLDSNLNNIGPVLINNIGVGRKFLFPVPELFGGQGRLRCGGFKTPIRLLESRNINKLSVQII